MEIEYGNLSKIMVTMELWENQNFWPIKGWRCPLGISQFQVHFTDKTLNSTNFPNIPLPSEWKWSNEWSVDKSRNFGSPDSDGWVYGPTFDRISQNVISLTATGTASSLCLCRKRRWSRSMICSSASILQGVLHRVNHIKSERMKIQQFMIDKSSCVEQLKPFEDKRRTADQTAFHSILRPFSIIDNRLNSEMSTLNKMLLVVAVDSDFACGE